MSGLVEPTSGKAFLYKRIHVITPADQLSKLPKSNVSLLAKWKHRFPHIQRHKINFKWDSKQHFVYQLKVQYELLPIKCDKYFCIPRKCEHVLHTNTKFPSRVYFLQPDLACFFFHLTHFWKMYTRPHKQLYTTSIHSVIIWLHLAQRPKQFSPITVQCGWGRITDTQRHMDVNIHSQTAYIPRQPL